MGVPHQELSLLRCLYTGESIQQARRAIDALQDLKSPIPQATSPAQQCLEARVLLGLLEYRFVYTRYPLGVASVHPTPDSFALRVESEERAAEILFNLLPTYASDEVHGVPGLRITRTDRTAIELRVLGEPACLRMTGLPATIWRAALERTLTKWTDPDSMQLCWRSSRQRWTAAEREHRVQWEDENDDFVQLQQRGAWLGSGLLRRAGLLHTVSNTFAVDGYRGTAFDEALLVLRSSHVPEQGPGPQNIVAALADPVFGLPLRLTRFRGDTDESRSYDQPAEHGTELTRSGGEMALRLVSWCFQCPKRVEATLSSARRSATRKATLHRLHAPDDSSVELRSFVRDKYLESGDYQPKNAR